MFKMWMAMASADEQEALAALAGLSRNYLYRLANGKRKAGPATAARIAEFANKIQQENTELPRLSRASLCRACADCPYHP